MQQIPEVRFWRQRLGNQLERLRSQVALETTEASSLWLCDNALATFDAPHDGLPWSSLRVGDEWGGRGRWAAFKAVLTTPSHWDHGAVELRLRHHIGYLGNAQNDDFPAGPEGQVFLDGHRVGAIDREHSTIRLPLDPGRQYDVRAVVFAGRCECRHRLAALELALIDQLAEKLYYDLDMALRYADQVDGKSGTWSQLLAAVDAALKQLRYPDGGITRQVFEQSLKAAQETFDLARRAIAAGRGESLIVAVGQAHIDLAWLWSMKQARHKCVRTFATQVRLLRQYPDWVFLQSSPQAYAWVQEDAPDLFEQIQQLIVEGRWEVNGPMWVEPDTNLPSGESLVRQLLYGVSYCRHTLGIESKVAWLPDSFGFSAALPQLFRQAGVELMVTTKLSWNQYNQFPYDSFRWRGIDGTELPTHFVTTACNADVAPDQLRFNHDHRPAKTAAIPSLMTFGFGDGGGGVTEAMLQRGQRMTADKNVPGVPRMEYGSFASFARGFVPMAGQMPLWDGELYLELHRGTYTTHGRTKRDNRKNEIRLHDLEWLSCLAGPVSPDLHQVQRKLWQDLLLLQFHDILPGTSVGEVYRDEVEPMHAAIAAKADELMASLTTLMALRIDTSMARQPVVVFNTLAWDRCEPVQLPDRRWCDGVVVPAGGWTVVDATEHSTTAAPTADINIQENGRSIMTPFWSMQMDEQGRIVELQDRRCGRSVLATGAVGNDWQLFEENPPSDAWDIHRDYAEHPLPRPRCTSICCREHDAVHATIELCWRIGADDAPQTSIITQHLTVYAQHPRIDFATHVLWRQRHQLLKVAFPVDIRATEATYEIQFGHLRRPTHQNTSWDIARFEGCAQRFVDLSEHDYGVALLNDCKYGHDIHDGVIRLTCLRGTTAPDATADLGEHHFTYSLLPHQGSFQQAGVIQAAAELNTPLIAREVPPTRGPLPASFAPIRCSNPAVILDTIKPAEDGNGTIVRLYEAFGSHATATLQFAAAPASVSVTDILEQPMVCDTGLQHRDTEVSLRLRPFQVVSLRIGINELTVSQRLKGHNL